MALDRGGGEVAQIGLDRKFVEVTGAVQAAKSRENLGIDVCGPTGSSRAYDG